MPPKDAWSPERYERFREERAEPFRALLARLRARPGGRILDLGCGTGEHTATLHRALAVRLTLGVDRSAEMLAKASARLAPGLAFVRADMSAFTPAASLDLVFSNAALHWLPDHEAVLARWARWLAPDGEIAVQLPANEAHPSQAVAAEIAREPPFRDSLGGFERRSPALSVDAYRRALVTAGLSDAWAEERVFEHSLASPDDLVAWMCGTTLTAYAERLPDALFARFLERYRERLTTVLPRERPLRFPFRRILFGARRPAAPGSLAPRRLFVYGTLLRGGSNHALLGRARFLGRARTAASYRMHDLGGFPAIIPGSGGPITGEVYEIEAATLARLDELERVPNWYRRDILTLADGTHAEAYVHANDLTGHSEVPGGDWNARAGGQG
jgi:trans-aconitate 2-methyltransferase